MNRSLWKNIVQTPWLVLSWGAWVGIAFIRGLRLRYLEWKLKLLKAQRDHYRSVAGGE